MITIEKKDLIVAYIVSKNKALLNIEACDFSDNEINNDSQTIRDFRFYQNNSSIFKPKRCMYICKCKP